MRCHTDASNHFSCTEDFKKSDKNPDDCVACHMPPSGSIDIPHVSVHDHYIRKPTSPEAAKNTAKAFLGLVAINTQKPKIQSRVAAYLQQYERFEPNPVFLDSAFALLQLSGTWQQWVHYYYLKNDPAALVQFLAKQKPILQLLAELNHKTWDNADAWTAYRIAEAFRKFNDYDMALQFANRAVELAPNHPEFILKRSSIYALMQNWALAAEGYQAVLKANPKLPEAWSDLGYVLLAQGFTSQAEAHIRHALALNPDYLQAKINLLSVFIAHENWDAAARLAEEILAQDPENKRVKSAMAFVKSQI